MLPDHIPMDKCQVRHVYRIRSRNLGVGVYTGVEGGFIGIREKFGNTYLFTEDHHDTGAPYGTVLPMKDIGVLPDDIELRESGDTYDPTNNRLLAFDKPAAQGGRGWYYIDTGESKPKGKGSSWPTSKQNKALFEFLSKPEYYDEDDDTTTEGVTDE
jgi:hypothetical protein